MESIKEFDLIKSPLRINMINIIGRLKKCQIDLNNIFINFICDDIFLGIECNSEKKGEISLKRSMGNCINLTIKLNERIMKVKIYKSGTVHIPGGRTLNEGKVILRMLIKKINIQDCKPGILLNKTTYSALFEFNIDYIDRELLAKIIREKYDTYCLFIQNKYPGFKIEYIAKKQSEKDINRDFVTIIVHRSGKVGIKGVTYEAKVYESYNFIVNVIRNEYDKITVLNNTTKVINNFSN